MTTQAGSLLVCLPSTGFGGHERMLIRILTALSERIAIPVHVVCGSHPELLAELSKAANITFRIGYQASEGRRMSMLRSLVSTYRAISSSSGRVVLFAPGSVHVQRLHLLLAKLLGRRVAAYVPMCFPASIMGYRRSAQTDFITRVLGRSVDLWITITRAQQELLQRHFRFTHRIQIVPNVAMTVSAVTRATPTQGTPTQGCLQVVFLGRYDGWQKGLDWICRGLQESHDRWACQICFHFFGAGAFRHELERMAARYTLGEITVSGWTDAATALSRADLLLMPSRFEGFPLVFIEAAKAGVPILSSKFPGAHELLGEGAWVEFGDTYGLVSGLLRMKEKSVRQKVSAIQKACIEAQSQPGMFEFAVSELAQHLQ